MVDLSITIHSLQTKYTMNSHLLLTNKIQISSIGNGYKNNDIIKIQLITNLNIYITQKLLIYQQIFIMLIIKFIIKH